MRLGTYYRYLVSKELDLPISGDKILDIGCYDGFLLSRINAHKKFGIDVHVLRKYPNIRYIEGDFLNYDFGNKKFDRIFLFDVLEHIREDKIFLEKIVQLLSVGGIAILSTPYENIKIFPSFLQDWVDKRWKHIYRRGYTPQKIKQLLSDTEEKDTTRINIVKWNCPTFRFFYLFLSVLWRISPMLVKKVLDYIVKLDSRFREGKNGFLYVIIKHVIGE